MSSVYLTHGMILVLKYMELSRELMKIVSYYESILVFTPVVLHLDKIHVLLADGTFVY